MCPGALAICPLPDPNFVSFQFFCNSPVDISHARVSLLFRDTARDSSLDFTSSSVCGPIRCALNAQTQTPLKDLSRLTESSSHLAFTPHHTRVCVRCLWSLLLARSPTAPRCASSGCSRPSPSPSSTSGASGQDTSLLFPPWRPSLLVHFISNTPFFLLCCQHRLNCYGSFWLVLLLCLLHSLLSHQSDLSKYMLGPIIPILKPWQMYFTWLTRPFVTHHTCLTWFPLSLLCSRRAGLPLVFGTHQLLAHLEPLDMPFPCLESSVSGLSQLKCGFLT